VYRKIMLLMLLLYQIEQNSGVYMNGKTNI
jgi:hypothetical protein